MLCEKRGTHIHICASLQRFYGHRLCVSYTMSHHFPDCSVVGYKETIELPTLAEYVV